VFQPLKVELGQAGQYHHHKRQENQRAKYDRGGAYDVDTPDVEQSDQEDHPDLGPDSS
jgi:hypothetical protein